jgi:uncharacterized circularly permuted ATP-grasp superfamily protein
VIFGRDLTGAQLSQLKQTILAQPRRFITQESDRFSRPADAGGRPARAAQADLRAYVLTGKACAYGRAG